MHVELSWETIGTIVKKLMHTVEIFWTRPFSRSSVIYLDGTYVPLKRKYSDGKAYVKSVSKFAIFNGTGGRTSKIREAKILEILKLI